MMTHSEAAIWKRRVWIGDLSVLWCKLWNQHSKTCRGQKLIGPEKNVKRQHLYLVYDSNNR